MGVSSQEPRWPVIDRSPGFAYTVSNFSTSDIGAWLAMTATAVPVGYISGLRPKVAGPSAVTAGMIGALGGFMYAYQNSAGRLMGLRENDSEAKAAGKLKR